MSTPSAGLTITTAGTDDGGAFSRPGGRERRAKSAVRSIQPLQIDRPRFRASPVVEPAPARHRRRSGLVVCCDSNSDRHPRLTRVPRRWPGIRPRRQRGRSLVVADNRCTGAGNAPIRARPAPPRRRVPVRAPPRIPLIGGTRFVVWRATRTACLFAAALQSRRLSLFVVTLVLGSQTGFAAGSSRAPQAVELGRGDGDGWFERHDRVAAVA